MNLIIIEKNFENFDLIKSNKNFFKNKKNYVINFSSKNLSLSNWFIYKIIDISNLIFLEYKKNRPNLFKLIKKNLIKILYLRNTSYLKLITQILYGGHILNYLL